MTILMVYLWVFSGLRDQIKLIVKEFIMTNQMFEEAREIYSDRDC